MDKNNTIYFACTTMICITTIILGIIFGITNIIKHSQDIELQKYTIQNKEVNTNE